MKTNMSNGRGILCRSRYVRRVIRCCSDDAMRCFTFLLGRFLLSLLVATTFSRLGFRRGPGNPSCPHLHRRYGLCARPQTIKPPSKYQTSISQMIICTLKFSYIDYNSWITKKKMSFPKLNQNKCIQTKATKALR